MEHRRLSVVLLTHHGYGGSAMLRGLLDRGRRPGLVIAETESRPRKKRAPGPAGRKSSSRSAVGLIRSKYLELGVLQGTGFFVGRVADRVLRTGGFGSRYPFGLRVLRRLEMTWLRILHAVLYGYPLGAYDPSERRIWLLEELCEAHDIPLRTVRSHNGPEARAALESANADVIVLAGTRIIHAQVLALAKVAVINKHASLLPRYRGLKAEFWALREGDTDGLGVTVHRVTPGLDAGPILLQRGLEFREFDSHVSLRVRSQDLGASMVCEAIDRLEKEPDYVGVQQPSGDWPTYSAPQLGDLTGYRAQLKRLWRRERDRKRAVGNSRP